MSAQSTKATTFVAPEVDAAKATAGWSSSAAATCGTGPSSLAPPGGPDGYLVHATR